MTAVRYFLIGNISLVYAETEEDYINFLNDLGKEVKKKVFLMNESIKNRKSYTSLQIVTNLESINRAKLSFMRNSFPTEEKIPAIYLHSGNWDQGTSLILHALDLQQNMIIATDDLGVLFNFLIPGRAMTFSSFCKKSRLALRKIYI